MLERRDPGSRSEGQQRVNRGSEVRGGAGGPEPVRRYGRVDRDPSRQTSESVTESGEEITKQDLGDTEWYVPERFAGQEVPDRVAGVPFGGNRVENVLRRQMEGSRQTAEKGARVVGPLVTPTTPGSGRVASFFGRVQGSDRGREVFERVEYGSDPAPVGGGLTPGNREAVGVRGRGGPTEEKVESIVSGGVTGVTTLVPGTLLAGKEVTETTAYAAGVTEDAQGKGPGERAGDVYQQGGLLVSEQVESAQERPFETLGALAFTGPVAGKASPVRYRRANVPTRGGTSTYRGVTLESPGSSRPLVGVRDRRPTAGTPEVDIVGSRKSSSAEGYAPRTQLEQRITDKNLRRQLEGEDLEYYEAAQELGRLSNRPISKRLRDKAGQGSETTVSLEEGIRQSEQIPDEAAPEVAEYIRENDAMLGGSTAQLMQSGKSRTPDDIDIYARDPERAERELAEILRKYEDRDIRERNGIEVRQEDGGYDHMVDISERSRGVGGRKEWGGRLYAPTYAREGGQIQPLESQISSKLEGGVRVFDEEVGPKGWRRKDVVDTEAAAEALIEERASSLNPLQRYRARRAEEGLEDFREAAGEISYPEGDVDSWAELEGGFETTTMETGVPRGSGDGETAIFREFLSDDRGQVDIGGGGRRGSRGGSSEAETRQARGDSGETDSTRRRLEDSSSEESRRLYSDRESSRSRSRRRYPRTSDESETLYPGASEETTYPAPVEAGPSGEYPGVASTGEEPGPGYVFDEPGDEPPGYSPPGYNPPDYTPPGYTPPGEGDDPYNPYDGPGVPGGGPSNPYKSFYSNPPPADPVPDNRDGESGDESRRGESSAFGSESTPGEDVLHPGWLNETVFTIATGGRETPEAPSQSELEASESKAFRTGEFAVAAFLDSEGETAERGREIQELFGFGGGASEGGFWG